MSIADRTRVRDLAKRVRELAEQPIMAQRRAQWQRHNALERVRPMILIFPEGSWREIHPESNLQCESEAARHFEDQLLGRLLYPEVIRDDSVIEAEWIVGEAIHDTGWGIERQWTASSAEKGAGTYVPVIQEPSDLKKLKFPEVVYDPEASQRNLDFAQSLVGDTLDVRLKGVSHLSFHPASIYCHLRGLEQVMCDMCENPGMLHDAMAFLEAGYHHLVDQYEELNLLALNNDGTYHSSGGVGYTDELPAADYDPERLRTRDLWASAEAQEFAQVGPEMHEEFVLQYERRLLSRFGLNGYGCCEDLTLKLDYVLSIPNIRRVSISPFASDLEVCAEKLGDRCIFSWKPHPAHLVGGFDAAYVRDYIRRTLEIAKGCVVEMILKDTHTCENHPERFTQWSMIARELAEQYP
ncbi:MAG: hypothetical protein GWP08_18715 [Nitrospiraceae bacterium]|nr:hypothetical protein [Nitrospiraceae bacterium]